MSRDSRDPTPPPVEVQRAFGAVGPPERFDTGEGTTFRVGHRVLKPVADRREAGWIGGVLDRVNEDGFRLARPVRAASGAWVHDGWTAWRFVEGRSVKQRWDEVVTAGARFHRAIRDVPRPSFLDERTNQWAVGDRMAFGEQDALIPTPIDEQVTQLRACLGDLQLASQVIHGDLTQNVLLADNLSPAIIDFSPYYRPTGYATAIIAVDAIVWCGAPSSLTELIEPAYARFELFARALICRLVATALNPVNDSKRLQLQARAHAQLVDRVIRELRRA